MAKIKRILKAAKEKQIITYRELYRTFSHLLSRNFAG